MDQKFIIGGVVLLIIAAVGISFIAPAEPAQTTVPTGKYTAFAQCIKDSGATFFGAWWCPHCKEQKEMFGDAASLLPYVECSTTDGKGQTLICIDNAIKNYPTWVINGATTTGTIPLADLATQTNCPLPVE